MGRLFESIIRKKKVSPIFLEFICMTSILLFGFLITRIGKWYWQFEQSGAFESLGRTTPLGIYMLTIFIFVVLLILWFRVAILLFKEIAVKGRRIERKIVFIDQAENPIYPNNKFQTFIYFFLTEPYIYRMRFLVDTYTGEPYNDTREKLHFNLPVHFSYKRKPDYNFYDLQYMADERKTDTDKKSLRFGNYKVLRNKNGRDWRQYSYYITYEKAQALNRLFDIVELPAFKIVVDDGAQVLHEIHPIDGREYPEEAYELMKKINQMYP